MHDNIITDKYALYNGDCVNVLRAIPNNSVHYSIFSPPFAELYTYSDDPRDMSNARNYDEFFMHFDYLVPELYRVCMPGRNISFHCTDVPAMKERDGYIGLKDFPGDLIRVFQKHGFVYHSRHVIWKDPLIEVTRTKALGLMYKQLCKDSVMCRAGIPDNLITMRKIGDNNEPVSHDVGTGLGGYVGDEDNAPIVGGVKYAHSTWQKYASPVWSDIRQTHTLQSMKASNDEKHICPLQLDTIERAITLWSNPRDIVLSPFGGIGSEPYMAVKMNRYAIAIELKDAYFGQMVKNVRAAELEQTKLAL